VTAGSAWIAAAYLLLQVIGAAALVVAMILLSFGARDAFCYPDYPQILLVAWASLTATSALTLSPGTVLSWARLRRPLLVLLPWIAVALALACLFGADLLSRIANDTHCAAGPPEVQDGTAAMPPLARAMAGFSLALVAAAAIATLAITAKIAGKGHGEEPA
jgi:hypothetical protein